MLAEENDVPDRVRDLDNALRDLPLGPRASLGAEIAGRFRGGERAPKEPRRRLRGALVWGGFAASVILCTAIAARRGYIPVLDRFAATQTVDRCCADLDGGGRADDGVLVETVRGHRVLGLRMYEERDADGIWSPGETIRFSRRGAPALQAPGSPDALVTRSVCCSDYDGGGKADDGVLVLASQSGDVLMAALFDRSATRYPTLLR